MPLLVSPIDGSPMKQIQRFGIELDICPTSGGVWLDKGELEKLMALIKEAAEEEKNHYREREERYKRHEREQEHYESSRNSYGGGYQSSPYPKEKYYEGGEYSKGKYKKKSALSQVMEIFDF